MLTHTRALSVGQKAGWGLADMGIVVLVIVKQLLVLSFLTNYLNVPVGIAGLLTTSVLIFDIITDPIVGYLSDRTHSRWGRRVPWMVIGALILSGGIIGLFGVPQSLSLLGTIIWVGGFLINYHPRPRSIVHSRGRSCFRLAPWPVLYSRTMFRYQPRGISRYFGCCGYYSGRAVD